MNEFLDPKVVVLDSPYIAILPKTSEIDQPSNPRWPPAAILDPKQSPKLK